MITMTASDRARIAAAVGMHEQYLYQCLSGRRPVPIERCVAIERATAGAVMRWDLRPHDWRDIWPELAARADAPGAQATVAVSLPQASCLGA